MKRWLLIPLIISAHLEMLPAQALTSLMGSKTATTPAEEDSLHRETPRSAIRAFLEACHNERYVQASLYLDLQNLPVRQRTSQGADYAKQLADILDRDSHFELAFLSDAPAGTSGDNLRPNQELLVSIPSNGTHVNLYMQREDRAGGASLWLVSQDAIAKLPQLDEVDDEGALEKKLPVFLVTTKLLGTSLWIWFSLVLTALFLSAASRLLSKLVISISRPIAKRYSKSVHAYRLETFTEPLRLLVSIAVFRAVMEFLDPSALLRDYMLKVLTLLFAFGCASLIMRIIDVIFDQIHSRLSSRERALTYSVLPLGVRVLKVLVFCAFVLFILSAWGYNTNTILAGVGVGGLAVALAAQKTIENFFGGVSVITDRPVLVGDFCQFGGQVGTIEDIGLRSTRIRTLDRTIVTIPNSQFSTMTLENYSRRDMMWFHPALHLKRGTTSDQVALFMEKMTDILKSDPMISIGGVPLRFTKIDDQSLNIEIFAYVLTDDFDKYLAKQTELLLLILKAGEQSGISFATPIVESLNVASGQEAAVSSTSLS